MNPHEAFRAEVEENIRGLGEDSDLQALSRVWVREITPHRYAYNFTWMGRPIIQFPQDMIAMQELIWDIRPDLIIETGIAHGGSLIFYASLLELIGGPGVRSVHLVETVAGDTTIGIIWATRIGPSPGHVSSTRLIGCLCASFTRSFSAC